MNHYGYGETLTITAIGTDCFNEYGTFGTVTIASGKLIAKDGGFIGNASGAGTIVEETGGYIGVLNFKDTPITSVVIPINEEFYKIKVGIKPPNNVGIEEQNKVQTTLLNCQYSNIIKNNLLTIYSKLRDDIVSNGIIQKNLNIKESATKYIKILVDLGEHAGIPGNSITEMKAPAYPNNWIRFYS